MGIVGVVGAGTIGVGVAHVFAAAGSEVVLVDTAEAALDRVPQKITELSRLQKLVTMGRDFADPQQVLSHIRTTTDSGDLGEAYFVIENVDEDWSTKRDVFSQLDRVCPPDCIFASNTSAIPITRIASVTSRPELVLGMHFMNPPPLKKTVEVIRGEQTTDGTLDAARRILSDAGKDCVVVNDAPGFVSNRVLMLTINEAISLVDEGVADAKQVDAIFKKCFGHPMGPLETADLIGLDTILKTLEVLQDHFDSPRFSPCPLLRRLVDSGTLGRKSGHGFYDYE